jgi:hypothetical protein
MSYFRFVRLHSIQTFLLIPALVLTVSAAGRAQNADSRSTGADDEEFVRNQEQWTHSIESSLIDEKFADLDRMADQYRREKTRLPGGEWRLRLFYEALDAPRQTDQDTRDHITHLEHWVQQRPDSITARVALATSLHRWAWVARGHSYADKVTPEGWKLFNERMKQSQSTLEAAASVSAMCPQWYSEMMAVGLAQSWDAARMKEIFDRGIQFEPGYYYLYLQYANYLLPKWDGHSGDSSAFAKSSADGVGGSAGDILYFQIATVLIKRGDDSFPVHEMDWDRIQHGYQALSAQYGTSRRTMNQLAFMAYKVKDVTVARQQFEAIGDHWARGVWGGRELFDRARDWARASTSGSDSR